MLFSRVHRRRPAAQRWVGCALALIGVGASSPVLAQDCLWGGTSSMEPPEVTPLGAQNQAFPAPGRLAVDGVGSLYVADPAAGRVLVLDAWGAVVNVKIGLLEPSAVAVGGDGSIYVAEAGAGRVSVFDADWNFVQYLGAGDGEFVLPNDIALASEVGPVYVSDGDGHQVRVYSTSGAFEFAFGEKGTAPGQFDFPAAVYVAQLGGPPGSVRVLVADQNNDRVQIFDSSGTYLWCFGGSAADRVFGRIVGLTGDDSGRIYVSDAFQGHVQVLDPQLGVVLATIGSFGSGANQLRTPLGLVIDPFNRLMVSAVNNGRVEQFGLDEFTLPPSTEVIFEDGFETGNLDRWSLSVQ